MGEDYSMKCGRCGGDLEHKENEVIMISVPEKNKEDGGLDGRQENVLSKGI